MEKLLTLNHVDTTFYGREGNVKAVCDVTLSIDQGEIVALVGETGCGKSVLGQTILQLLPSSAQTKGEILFQGKDLSKMTEKEIRPYRGKVIAYVNQNPSEALNPMLTIGTQMIEAVRLCEKAGKKEAYQIALNTLKQFSFEKPEEIMKKYPFELSGGMRQRALTAMAMCGHPFFLIADEPTKGLDALIRGQVIETFRKFIDYTGCGGLIITHDLHFARNIADKIALMYAGEIVEYAPVQQFFADPIHPYLKGLLASMPSNGLHVLKGSACDLINLPKGCRFAERCEEACKECIEIHPELKEIQQNHQVRCKKYD